MTFHVVTDVASLKQPGSSKARLQQPTFHVVTDVASLKPALASAARLSDAVTERAHEV